MTIPLNIPFTGDAYEDAKRFTDSLCGMGTGLFYGFNCPNFKKYYKEFALYLVWKEFNERLIDEDKEQKREFVKIRLEKLTEALEKTYQALKKNRPLPIDEESLSFFKRIETNE